MTLLHILTYASIVIFVIAIAVRAARLATTPVHLRWELYPVAHEKDRVQYGGSYFEELDWWTKPRETSMFGQVKVMIPEILLLKGVWEHNRSLWPGSFAMHFAFTWDATKCRPTRKRCATPIARTSKAAAVFRPSSSRCSLPIRSCIANRSNKESTRGEHESSPAENNLEPT